MNDSCHLRDLAAAAVATRCASKRPATDKKCHKSFTDPAAQQVGILAEISCRCPVQRTAPAVFIECAAHPAQKPLKPRAGPINSCRHDL